MLTINLVPWREEAREKKKNRLFKELALSLLITLGLYLGYHLYIMNQIQDQEKKNRLIKQTLSELKIPFQETKTLTQYKKQLLAENQAIDALQRDRTAMVHMLDELVHVLPKGVYLTQLTFQGQELTLVGKTESSTLVSLLMKNIEQAKWIKQPKLKTITADADSPSTQQAFSTFTLTLQCHRPKDSPHAF